MLVCQRFVECSVCLSMVCDSTSDSRNRYLFLSKVIKEDVGLAYVIEKYDIRGVLVMII